MADPEVEEAFTGSFLARLPPEVARALRVELRFEIAGANAEHDPAARRRRHQGTWLAHRSHVDVH